MIAQDRATVIALQAAGWLAAEEDLLPVFLSSTGAGLDDFKNNLQDPMFQGALLDFLLMDDAWVQRFCEATELAPDMPMQARAALPGGGQVHWT